MTQELENCRVCQGAFRSIFARQDGRYGRCSKCDAICKILTKDEYLNLGATYDPGDIFDTGNASLIRSHLMVDAKKDALRAIEKRLDPNRPRVSPIKILDVGCGMGGYLIAGIELGYEVSGVEPSEKHSSVGRDHLSLPIRNAYFNSKDFNGEEFDIVILSHVIEHIFDPSQFMEDLARVVKPGGIAVILTPNANSTLAKLAGKFWSMLNPIDHVTMMAPASLKFLKPAQFELNVTSAEILWEPAVVLLQAGRDMARAYFKNDKVQPTPDARHTMSKNSFRGTIAQINSRVVLRIALSAISVPLWMLNRALNRAHCLTAYYYRKA